MAKGKFRAGEEFDFLSPDELKKQLELAIWQLRAPDFDTITLDLGVVATAAGTVGQFSSSTGVQLYQVPEGYEDTIHRIQLGDSATSPGAPNLTAAAFTALYRNIVRPDRCIAFSPNGGGGANVSPWTQTYGRHNAPILRGGELLLLVATGFAGSATISIGLQARRRNMNPGIGDLSADTAA